MATLKDIFTNPQSVTDEEKILAVAVWLKEQYEIELNDQAVALAMTEVHRHNGSEKHFGHPTANSAFAKGTVQIVYATGHWHLTITDPSLTKTALVHPKDEAGSWSKPENQKYVGELANLLSLGKLSAGGGAPAPVAAPAPNESEPTGPGTVFISGNSMSISLSDETPTDPFDATPAPGSYQAASALGLPGGSISIDMSSYGAQNEDETK